MRFKLGSFTKQAGAYFQSAVGSKYVGQAVRASVKVAQTASTLSTLERGLIGSAGAWGASDSSSEGGHPLRNAALGGLVGAYGPRTARSLARKVF